MKIKKPWDRYVALQTYNSGTDGRGSRNTPNSRLAMCSQEVQASLGYLLRCYLKQTSKCKTTTKDIF